LLGGNPAAMRPLDACTAAAEELSALGIDRVHTEPNPLRATSIRRRSIAGLAYERMTFEHDPALPPTLEAEGLGGPARAVVHVCRHRGGPRPWLVWVHGAGQGGTEDLLMSGIGRIHRKLGFNIAMPVQPGHGVRRRQWPAYRGCPQRVRLGMRAVDAECRELLGGRGARIRRAHRRGVAAQQRKATQHKLVEHDLTELARTARRQRSPAGRLLQAGHRTRHQHPEFPGHILGQAQPAQCLRHIVHLSS
jgi:hypothetical protein